MALPGDVSPHDIRFDPQKRAFLDREADGRYRLRAWTEPGLTDALVVVRRGRDIVGYPLELVADTDRFSFWELVGPVIAGDQYSLAFRNRAGKPVYFVPAGVSNAVERLDRWTLPDLGPFDVPAWARGTVIYQIFPDRFANGDPALDPVGAVPWGSPPKARGFQGGDLRGIIDHLDYLEALGVDLIYLNPIFLSPSTHRYDTVDYHQVDPHLGGNDVFAELVKATHGRRMRIIIDASFNHCHPRFFAFQDLLEKGQNSQYRDWFTVNEWPIRIKVRGPLRAWQREWLPIWAGQAGLEIDYLDEEGAAVEPTYDSWYGVATMPRVNLANPDARAYMLDATARWLRDPGVDGWRMDVARYVDSDFWPEFRRVARSGPTGRLSDRRVCRRRRELAAGGPVRRHDELLIPGALHPVSGHRADRWSGGKRRICLAVGAIPVACHLGEPEFDREPRHRPFLDGRRGGGLAAGTWRRFSNSRSPGRLGSITATKSR